ncbi:MAG TPA: hypothetical protein VF618_15110 [Thermoanaerobaculia bacterium]
MSTMKLMDETKVAEAIVSVLPEGVLRICSDDRESIRYAVRAADLTLRTIVMSRASLRRLAQDPQQAVKIEYLQRDLLRNATRREEFQYPRPSRLFAKVADAKRAAMALVRPIASVL